jgi:hypothetical protein
MPAIRHVPATLSSWRAIGWREPHRLRRMQEQVERRTRDHGRTEQHMLNSGSSPVWPSVMLHLTPVPKWRRNGGASRADRR